MESKKKKIALRCTLAAVIFASAFSLSSCTDDELSAESVMKEGATRYDDPFDY